MHRILRLVCLIAAILAPLLSAQIVHRLAHVTMKEIGPVDQTLPELTRTMIVRVADDSFPIKLLAGAIASATAIAGLFTIFSSRLSRETAGTSLVVICTIALVSAVLLLAATSIAISIGRAPLR